MGEFASTITRNMKTSDGLSEASLIWWTPSSTAHDSGSLRTTAATYSANKLSTTWGLPRGMHFTMIWFSKWINGLQTKGKGKNKTERGTNMLKERRIAMKSFMERTLERSSDLNVVGGGANRSNVKRTSITASFINAKIKPLSLTLTSRKMKSSPIYRIKIGGTLRLAALLKSKLKKRKCLTLKWIKTGNSASSMPLNFLMNIWSKISPTNLCRLKIQL